MSVSCMLFLYYVTVCVSLFPWAAERQAISLQIKEHHGAMLDLVDVYLKGMVSWVSCVHHKPIHSNRLQYIYTGFCHPS